MADLPFLKRIYQYLEKFCTKGEISQQKNLNKKNKSTYNKNTNAAHANENETFS